MRSLGSNASFNTFRWDLTFLYSALLSEEERPEVAAIGTEVAALIDALLVEREVFERAEAAEVAASAVRGRRDTSLDRKVVTLGGVARSVAPEVYRRLFGRLSPSAIGKAALETEITEVQRLLGELAALPEGNEIRAGHEEGVRNALASLRAANEAAREADVALALARSRASGFKLHLDRQRVEIFGRLVSLTGEKQLADSYFRPTTRSPAKDEEGGGDTPPTP